MTMRIGRAVLNSNPRVGISLSGTTLSVPFEIVGADANEMKAIRQQVSGLEGNVDEPIIPFTWSEDASFDGFYSVSSVSIGSNANFLNTGFVADCQITLEQMPGFANPIFETVVQSVLRTNAFGYTVPPSIVAVFIGTAPASELDSRGITASLTQIQRRNSDGGASVDANVFTTPAPLAVGQTRMFCPPSQFYYGSARVEMLFGATWREMSGRNAPMNAVWRISNGNVRLTSAQGATSGTLEVWDQSAAAGLGAWESANVSHWTNGAVGPGIGLGNGTTQASVSILRNSPEQVTVRCGGLSEDFTYTLRRGDMYIAATWTCRTATKYGAGYTTTNAATAVTAGLRKTANDANGNRMVFALPLSQTQDLVNGGTNVSVAATSGTMMIGAELAGSSAASGNAAGDLVNQFMGVTSWRQSVTPR